LILAKKIKSIQFILNKFLFFVHNTIRNTSNIVFTFFKEVLIMSDNNANTQTRSNSKGTVWQIIGRLVTAAVVLAITAFFTPGFQINNIWSLAAAAIVLTVIDYLITKFTGLHASSFGKGFVGFVLSAVVLYVTQYFVAGYTVSWMAAIIGALVYGVVDYFLPGEQQ
jgi:uncharacterized membrane protein YvlD (DUF360 family)